MFVNRRAWLLFLLVSLLWGIPYYLIKIAIDESCESPQRAPELLIILHLYFFNETV